MSIRVKRELQDLLSGTSQEGRRTTIEAAACYLVRSSQTSAATEGSKHFKREEEKNLEQFISARNFWLENIDFSQYISEGAEQKVYLVDSEHVLKLNDSIYYRSWKDYFFNLLLHNYFFSDTAYELIGFIKKDEVLYAVVQQPFVITTERTDLVQVRSFLTSNGFKHIRNNDYLNPELGIILEDLHDENVLTRNETLYFIDTVFTSLRHSGLKLVSSASARKSDGKIGLD